MAMNIKETDSEWIIALDNCIVQLIKIDFRLGLFLHDGENTLELQIETPFNFLSKDGVAICVPENTQSLGPVLQISNMKVIALIIKKKGEMHIQFESEFSIEIRPDPAYEAWQLSGSTGFLFVCPPEGNVSFFRKSAE